jgi:hypothetical protein
MAEWKKVIVSGSNAELNRIFASGAITGSAISSSGKLFANLEVVNQSHIVTYDDATGEFFYTSSAGIAGGGIFVDRGTYYYTDNTLQISGSTLQSSPSASGTGTSSVNTGTNNNIYAFLVSESIYSFNHNVGYPTANSWKENLNGSYFNNFDANTNISEVLRFIAGLLSSSAPAPSPNTKFYNALGFRLDSSSGVQNLVGRLPSASVNQYTTYLKDQGFYTVGLPFISNFYSGSAHIYTYSSSMAGSTNVSSSADAQLFGLGLVNETVYISASTTFKFFSSSNETTPSEQSSSQTLITLSSPNSSLGGASRNTIPTANPVVIPPLYQDGKFVGSFSSSFNATNQTALSSSGYYHYSQSVTIYTGSLSNIGIAKTNDQRVFRTPSTLASLIGLNSIVHTQTTSPLTITSRSLSGAPYLSQSTYNYTCTSSGIFSPLYATGSTIYTTTVGNGITAANPTSLDINTSNGQINTANIVYSSSNSSTARSTGIVPSENDVIKVNSTVNFNPTAGSTSIAQATIAPTTIAITANGLNRNGATTQTATNLSLFTAGTFGQPAASGTMAYYNRSQSYDEDSFSRTNAGVLSASFKGESRRLQLTDNILSGSYSLGNIWNTSFNLYNLGTKDLQVKPGYLVKPGGSYGYWITDPDPSEEYKYYAVGFTRDISSNQPSISMSLAGNTTLVEWTDTTSNNSIAALIIPQSVLATSTQAAGIDPKATSDTTAITADTAGTNPFGRTLTVLTNTNAQKTNPFVINFPTVPAYPLNSTYKNFVLLLRYKGDPTPLTSVTFTITA